MITEDQLVEATGLVARFYARAHKISQTERVKIQRRLLAIGIQLKRPIAEPPGLGPGPGPRAAA